ncbi:hypothetical protein AHiyo8_04360 [Arthrobacter sp. Hiyo8]|nr:hypothetical protein AHiyo8_04360 [Arthrobacter sp. Hiyo8]
MHCRSHWTGIHDAGPHPDRCPADGPDSNAPLETTQASNKIPVYWIGRSDTDTFLYREFRDNPGNENPITTALRIMMSQKPLDHDFFTPWQNPGSLATSISGKNVVTVDVSRDAFNSNLDAGMAQRAVQELVYTATAAAASSGLIDSGQQIKVTILVDGHTDYMAFARSNSAIRWSATPPWWRRCGSSTRRRT